MRKCPDDSTLEGIASTRKDQDIIEQALFDLGRSTRNRMNFSSTTDKVICLRTNIGNP